MNEMKASFSRVRLANAAKHLGFVALNMGSGICEGESKVVFSAGRTQDSAAPAPAQAVNSPGDAIVDPAMEDMVRVIDWMPTEYSITPLGPEVKAAGRRLIWQGKGINH